MIQNLIFKICFFENIFSGIQLFYIRLHVPVDIFRASSVQKVSKSAKITKKDHSFYNTVSLKKPH